MEKNCTLVGTDLSQNDDFYDGIRIFIPFNEANPNFILDAKDKDWNTLYLSTTMNFFDILLKNRGYVFLNDIIKYIGLPLVRVGYMIGWTYENSHKIIHEIYPDGVLLYLEGVILEEAASLVDEMFRSGLAAKEIK